MLIATGKKDKDNTHKQPENIINPLSLDTHIMQVKNIVLTFT